MTARAIWKAELHIADRVVPVRLYAAIEDASVHFRLLHREDGVPVSQRLVDAASGEVVAKEGVQKGVEVERGVFVVLTEEDRAALEPKPSRAIHVERTVAPSEVDSRWLVRPYYLGPDGDTDGYFALAEALAERQRIGIAHWVMRKKRYQGAIVVRGGYLVLVTLRHAEDVLELGRVSPPPERMPTDRELSLAEQLVATLEGPFNPAEYHDETRARVQELLQAKAAGRAVERPKRAMRKTEGSLENALLGSLKRKGRQRAG